MKTNFIIIIGWLFSAASVRVSYRIRSDPGNRNDDLGFRLVKG